MSAGAPATPKVEERTFVGSSRRIRVVAIVSSRSVNQPVLRYQVFVWVGEGGNLKNVAIPIKRVIIPSIKKSHLKKSRT